MKKWNHYICPLCSAATVARHDDEGVTPFMIRCRVTPNCGGMAESTFFAGPQNDDQVAHVIFFRPATRDDALRWVGDNHPESLAWMMEHYDKGGQLMREAAAEKEIKAK